MLERVRDFLGLDEAQFGSLVALEQARVRTMAQLLRTVSEQQRQLARLLGSPNPEPAAIGSVLITLRGTQEQIETAQDTFRNGFLDILTEDQMQRLAELERFIQTQRAVPAFLSLGLVETSGGRQQEPRQVIGQAIGLNIQ